VIFTDSPRRANPILVPNTVMNAPAGHAAIELGVRGVNTTLNHREVSAETAIAFAAGEIRRGRADAVLAGGGDILSEFFMAVLGRFRALSPTDGRPEGIRPFDLERNGTVAGEGVGVLCLERLETAEARGALPYCEIAGWGLSAAPAPANDWPTDPRGSRLALDRALASAAVTAEEIDLVSAAANGGLRLDRLEADVLAGAFAGSPRRPRVTAVKGALGEGFASGGIRSVATALALSSRTLPPTCGLSRPISPLNFVRRPETDPGIRCALVNGMASGGTFAALVLKTLE
jgi:3-oxoacyl-[acyl-carrier-protein] synthase II